MANIASARKRARSAEKSRQRNVAQRSKLRTYIKHVVKAIEAGDQAQARQLYTACIPVLDSSARKGIVHTNKAARHKQRLNARIQAMS